MCREADEEEAGGRWSIAPADQPAVASCSCARAIAPNWSYSNEDGMPVVESILEMQDFWTGPYFHFVEKKVTREELFDLSVAKEAKARLDRERPFGN